MTSPADKNVLADARESLANPISFAELLTKLSPKDRVSAERRVTVLDTDGADPRAADLWRRLACAMMTLAPAAKLVGKQTVQCYIPDGKYRMQVFALEDLQDGKLSVYCPDVLGEAMAAGLVSHPPDVEPCVFVVEASGEPIRIDSLDRASLNPGAHYKDMVGWNRKALRIILPPSASPPQVELAELMCAIAATHFVRPAKVETPQPAV